MSLPSEYREIHEDVGHHPLIGRFVHLTKMSAMRSSV